MGGDWGDRCSTSVHDAMPLAWVHCMQAKKERKGLTLGLAWPLHIWIFPNLENPKSPWGKNKPWGQEWAIFDAKINTKHIGKTLTPTPMVLCVYLTHFVRTCPYFLDGVLVMSAAMDVVSLSGVLPSIPVLSFRMP